jgi:alcohol dehydrogenase class IV
MTGFEFTTAGQIVFGAGARQRVGALCRPLGTTALVVTGRTPERSAWLPALLEHEQIRVVTLPIAGEPSVPVIQDGVAAARAHGCDLVVAVGGGSAIDAGKAIAALATNTGQVLDYLEVVGRGHSLAQPSLPCVAIPTTAGTGSEATRNAVLTVPGARVKVSLRSPSMMPRIAIVDPELTRDLPAAITAATGLDALTQLIEAYVSVRASAMTDPLCVEGIRLVAASIRPACHGRGRADAREAMALASLWGGMALANAGLGAVHGLAGPIGGMFTAPHGAVCAALLPHVFAANLRACRVAGRAPAADGSAGPLRSLDRLTRVARLLTGEGKAAAEDAVPWLSDLVDELDIPRLGQYGVTMDAAPSIAAQAQRSNSMKGNPVALTDGDLTAIVQAAR